MKTIRPASSRLATAGTLALLLSASVPLARSAILNWDSGGITPATGANGSSPGAPSNTAGTWNLANTNWSNGSIDAAWVNANNDTANFAGAADYQVTIAAGTAISAGALSSTNTFTTTLAGGTGASLTLSGPAPTISGAGNIAFSIALQGSSGFTKSGNGTLRFNTAATYGGDTVFNGGQITLGVNNSLPVTTKLTISSGNFSLQGKTQTLAGLAGNAGTVRTTSGNTSKLTIAGATTDTFSGSINDGATVGVALSFERAGTGTTNLNGTSAYRGSTTVSGGVLSLGSNLSATSSVTLSGGTLSSSVASVNLGVGAVSMSGGAVSPGGTSVGAFIVAANQSFSTTGGTLSFDLGTSFDRIIGSGTGAFSLSNSSLALNLGSGFSYASTYNLFQGFNSGSVSSLSITGYDNANYIAILGDGTTGPLGTLSFAAAAVPEPSACALLFGVAALGFVSRRRASRR